MPREHLPHRSRMPGAAAVELEGDHVPHLAGRDRCEHRRARWPLAEGHGATHPLISVERDVSEALSDRVGAQPCFLRIERDAFPRLFLGHTRTYSAARSPIKPAPPIEAPLITRRSSFLG